MHNLHGGAHNHRGRPVCLVKKISLVGAENRMQEVSPLVICLKRLYSLLLKSGSDSMIPILRAFFAQHTFGSSLNFDG